MMKTVNKIAKKMEMEKRAKKKKVLFPFCHKPSSRHSRHISKCSAQMKQMITEVFSSAAKTNNTKNWKYGGGSIMPWNVIFFFFKGNGEDCQS